MSKANCLKTIFLSLATCALCLGIAAAHAQRYPVKPVRVIVPFAPGSPIEVPARTVGQKIAESMGQAFVIDNRAGAGGLIGYEIAAKSLPDGYTIVMATVAFVTTSTIYSALPYDPAESFTPVTRFASVPYILVVAPQLPVASVRELVELARSRPGKLNYGTPGNGTAQHLMTELLKQQAGIDLVHIPYKSGAGAVTAILGGEAQLFFAGLPVAIPHMKAGRLRALAVTTPKRFPTVPEVPTIIEAGWPALEVDQWHAIIAPARLPRPLVERLNGEIVKVLGVPEVARVLLANGAEANPSTPAELQALIRSEIAKWTRAAKAAGLSPQPWNR